MDGDFRTDGHYGHDREAYKDTHYFSVPVPLAPPVRPCSARSRAFGACRRQGPRRDGAVITPGRGGTCGNAALAAYVENTLQCPRKPERPVSASGCRARSPPKAPAMKDPNHDTISALVLLMLQVYEHRHKADIWGKILDPLRSLVPCEDVKFVVRSIGPPRGDDSLLGPFDPESRPRVRSIKVVEHWPVSRIEGQCALTQRICCIPSAEAERQHWHQYESSNLSKPANNETTTTISGPPTSMSSYLRCLVAVPLFDANGNVVAVAKLINRRSFPEGQPKLEFSKTDLSTLSAISAIFACVMPSPYITLPGSAMPRRPETQLWLTDDSIGARVRWQMQRELTGKLVHEILYGEVEYEDEYSACRRAQPSTWNMLPCGVLDPIDGPEGIEPTYEYRVPSLQTGVHYSFSVRARNLETSLEWSEPSFKLSTYLVPPYPETSEVIDLIPRNENTVGIEWAPFRTCDLGLQLIEYRVVAITGQDTDGASVEQVVAVFVSDGSTDKEVATIACLQNTGTYVFAIESRYPYLGSRTFTRAMMSDKFSFPTVDLTLPAPQPLALTLVGGYSETSTGNSGRHAPVLIQWPYPADLMPRLVLQYRTASMHDLGTSSQTRMQISAWNRFQGDSITAQMDRDGTHREVRVLQDPTLFDAHLAVQLRVVMPQESATSPPSAWFHARPPRPPSAGSVQLACCDATGLSVLLEWQCVPLDKFLGVARDCFGLEELENCHGQSLGPVSYAVQSDFSRGNGPSPTQFQVRIRFIADSSGSLDEWEELRPQLMPRVSATNTGATGPRMNMHCWHLQEKRWFSKPGAAFQVQMRHGNQLFWSAWVDAGTVEVSVRPPVPMPGHALRIEETKTDSVKLIWSPFRAAEEGLVDLEYRILCLEIPDGGDARPESGGRVVAWKTLDTVPGECEGSAKSSDGRPNPLQYTARGLQADRRYLFGVECSYRGLPPNLAAMSSSRLEAAEPLPRRTVGFAVLPEGLAAHAKLVISSKTEDVSVFRCGIVLKLRWRFRSAPAGTALPSVLSYQLSCVPVDHGNVVAKAVSQFLMPPSLLAESSRIGPSSCMGGAVATFTPERGACRESAVAEVELLGSAIEALFPTCPRLQFSVRVGDPATGAWSPWSDILSDVVELTVLPPAAPEGVSVAVAESLWTAAGRLPPHVPHGVRAVNLAWSPFWPAPGLPADQHQQLYVQYEVLVWILDSSTGDPSASSSTLPSVQASRPGVTATSLVTTLKTRATSEINGARLVLRQALPPVATVSDGWEMHRHQVPGENLYPSQQHFFQVIAKYVFSDGRPLREPRGLVPGMTALVSEEPYRPTPRNPAAPALEGFVGEHGHAAGRSAMIRLPMEESWNKPGDPDCLCLEAREGRVDSRDGRVVPAGSWVLVSSQSVEAMPDDDKVVFVRNLAPQVCQFRLRRGPAESQPTHFTDTCVWRPVPLAGDQFCVQMRAAKNNGWAGFQGLGVAMGVAADTSLFVKLIWPRKPPVLHSVPLSKYQVKYRRCGEDWHVLPTVDLPPGDLPVAECEVSELRHAHLYEFAVRLSNDLGRWSTWSPATAPLRLELPPPVPGCAVERGGIRIAVLNPNMVKLVWRPFVVPIAERTEVPVLLDESSQQRGSVFAEYEVIVHTVEGGVMLATQREAPAVFEDLQSDRDSPWIEADLRLESSAQCSFEIRARLQRGSWGPSVHSPPLPSRSSSVCMNQDDGWDPNIHV